MLDTNEAARVPFESPLSVARDEGIAYLDYVLDEIWDMFEQGVRVRCAPAHTPTLATCREGLPTLRTVVLRGVVRKSRMLLIHTDRRSGKFAELAKEPRCSLHVYDPGRKVQLRIEARATLHVDDAVADAQWAQTRPMSRVGYGGPVAPGVAVSQPEDATAGLETVPDALRRERFAVVALHVASIDWLMLGSRGHRRARFDFGATRQAIWLAP